MKYPGIDIDIRDVQLVELEILLKFDRICRKHNLQYQLFAGTLLGAIRHKGFIPWDDDIDVCMLRKDYDKFIGVCNEDLDKKKYFLQTCFSDPRAIVQFAKLRKNNTTFINKIDNDKSTHTGIYIDIFPLDNVKPGTMAGIFQLFLFKFLYALTTSTVRERVLRAHNKITVITRYLMYLVMKIIPKRCVDKAIQKVMVMFKGDDTKYVCHLTNGITRERFNRYLRESSKFYDIVEWEFEGYLFPVPANYHDVLTRNFGDYMTLPPEDKRFPHHGIIKVEFD